MLLRFSIKISKESTDLNEAQLILIDHMQTNNKQSRATGWIDKIPANQFSDFTG